MLARVKYEILLHLLTLYRVVCGDVILCLETLEIKKK